MSIEVQLSGQWTFNNSYQMLEAAVDRFGLAYLSKALAQLVADSHQLDLEVSGKVAYKNLLDTLTRLKRQAPCHETGGRQVAVCLKPLCSGFFSPGRAPSLGCHAFTGKY
jgi:hypothetical protein